MPWLIERPSPVPSPTDLVVKNGSKNWGSRLGLDPAAVVADRDHDRVPSRRGRRTGSVRRRRDRSPRSPATALIRRLRITWLICEGDADQPRQVVAVLDLDLDIVPAQPAADHLEAPTRAGRGPGPSPSSGARSGPGRGGSRRCSPPAARLRGSGRASDGGYRGRRPSRTPRQRRRSSRSRSGRRACQKLVGLLVQGHDLEDPRQVALEDREVVADVGQGVVDLVGHPGAQQTDRRQFLRLGEHRPHPLPLGLIADRADVLKLARQADRTERELERELLARLPAAAELDGLAHDPGPSRRPRRRTRPSSSTKTPGMSWSSGWPITSAGVVAEDLLGGRVEQGDVARAVGDDDGVEAALGELAVACLGLGQLAVLGLHRRGRCASGPRRTAGASPPGPSAR